MLPSLRASLPGLRAAVSSSSTVSRRFISSSNGLFNPSIPRYQTTMKCLYMPFMWTGQTDKPMYSDRYVEWEIMPRDIYGTPAHIPPDLRALIPYTYYVPPSYYPFLKRIGDETPELKPWMDKLIKGQLTHEDYEELFYKNAKPIKVHRSRIPQPYRTEEEMKSSGEVQWESNWSTFRQRVAGEYIATQIVRDYLVAFLLGLWGVQTYATWFAVYNDDMRLFYLEAPEHKINWVVPRGDV